jgi:hypothetical protein
MMAGKYMIIRGGGPVFAGDVRSAGIPIKKAKRV